MDQNYPFLNYSYHVFIVSKKHNKGNFSKLLTYNIFCLMKIRFVKNHQNVKLMKRNSKRGK